MWKCQAIIGIHYFDKSMISAYTFMNGRISLGGRAKNSATSPLLKSIKFYLAGDVDEIAE